ncbi:TPA: hypothetical protein QB264_000502 [Pasteurella multocida]|nr:hypothetical protein [Pasteurella multocida]
MTSDVFYTKKDLIKNQIENFILGVNIDDNDDEAPIRFGEMLGKEKVELILNLLRETAEISAEYGGFNGQFSAYIDFLSDREKRIHYFCSEYLYFLDKQENNPAKARERILKRRAEMIKKLQNRNK